MSAESDQNRSWRPGKRVKPREFGEGVVVTAPVDGSCPLSSLRAVNASVPLAALALVLGRAQAIIVNAAGGDRRRRRAWLCYQAHRLPLLDSAASLTSAKIDLLPHQVVLTHRVATTSPRRFLVADEVGLGKTIETALILRELASRGELKRALMVVPAGLVNNWHRELNEVFHLNFEVFGHEGDVTDRQSQCVREAQSPHRQHRYLETQSACKRLEEAPAWDLVVFDEAHHLTAYRQAAR